MDEELQMLTARVSEREIALLDAVVSRRNSDPSNYLEKPVTRTDVLRELIWCLRSGEQVFNENMNDLAVANSTAILADIDGKSKSICTLIDSLMGNVAKFPRASRPILLLQWEITRRQLAVLRSKIKQLEETKCPNPSSTEPTSVAKRGKKSANKSSRERTDDASDATI